MGKGTWKSKTEAPLPDMKTSAGMLQDWTVSILDATGTSSTGVKEVVSSPNIQTAVKQTIMHPVVLGLVVGVSLLLLSSMRR